MGKKTLDKTLLQHSVLLASHSTLLDAPLRFVYGFPLFQQNMFMELTENESQIGR